MTPADTFSGMNWGDAPYDAEPLSQAEQQRLAKAFVLNNDRVFMLKSNKIKNQLPEEQDAMVAWMRRVNDDNIWHATGGGRIYWLWEDMRKNCAVYLEKDMDSPEKFLRNSAEANPETAQGPATRMGSTEPLEYRGRCGQKHLKDKCDLASRWIDKHNWHAIPSGDTSQSNASRCPVHTSLFQIVVKILFPLSPNTPLY